VKPAARSGLVWAGTLVTLGLSLLMVWRIFFVLLPANDEGKTPESPGPAGPAQPDQAGEGRDVVFKYFDEKTGRLTLVVKASVARTAGARCELEEVELERRLGEGRGLLLARARRGVYDRLKGNGQLQDEVVARRVPEGAEEADMVLRSQELSWRQASGRLTSNARVEIEWNDPKGARSAFASGQGMVAERWAESVCLLQETRVELAGSALPRGMDLGGGRGGTSLPAGREPVRTVIESEGPASFEHDAEPGQHLIRFSRNVRARSAAARPGADETRLDCDDLDLQLRPAPASPEDPDGPDLRTAAAAAGAPLAAPAAARWLLTALGAPPVPGGAFTPRRGEGNMSLDLAVARGAVRIVSIRGGGRTEDVARGELAWYDHAAGIFWLDGRPDEPAEVVRGGRDQLLAERFWYNAGTGEAGTAGRSRVKLTAGDE
jgi:hypothetical protein